jgi:hypothetical protein
MMCLIFLGASKKYDRDHSFSAGRLSTNAPAFLLQGNGYLPTALFKEFSNAKRNYTIQGRQNSYLNN